MILEAIGAIIIFLEILIIIGEKLPDDYNCCAVPIVIFIMFAYLIFNNGGRLAILLVLTLITMYILKTGEDYQEEDAGSNNQNNNYNYQNNNTNNYNNSNNYNNNYYDHIVDEYSPKEKVKLPNKPVPTHNNPFKDNDKLQTKRPYNGKKTNINTADYNSLRRLPHIGDNRANRIIEYRNYRKIESIDELADVASLAKSEVNDIREMVIFNTESIKNDDDSLNQILDEIRNERAELKKERDELDRKIEEKLNIPSPDSSSHQKNSKDKKEDIPTQTGIIDINTATDEQLRALPSINIIRAKKIIQLRESGVYIKSFDDLREKLNLKDYELEQLRPLVKINVENTPNNARRLDL